MVDTIATGGTSTTAGLAQLIASLAPILLGGGQTTANQTGSSTTVNTGSNTSTTTSGAPSLADLQAVFDQASSNSTNDAATSAIVTNILHQAAIAFGPTRAAGNASGIYNSTVVSQMADEAQAQATAQAAQSVLNYKTAQQTIAENAGGSIGQLTAATAPKTTTGSNATTAVTTPKTTTTQQTAASIPGGTTLLGTAAGGLAGYSALDKLGLTQKLSGLLGSSDPEADQLLGPGETPQFSPDAIANSQAYSNALAEGVPTPDFPGITGIGTSVSDAMPAATQPAQDFLLNDSPQLYGTLDGAASTASDAASSAMDTVSSGATDLTSQVGDAASSAVSGGEDLLGSLGDTLSTGFSDIGNFFANLF